MTDGIALRYRRDEHEKRTKEIFEDLRNETRSSDDPEFFVRVEQINYSNREDGSAESVELSVFSKKIHDYDKETTLADRNDFTIRNNLTLRNYRPFFVSIIVPIVDKRNLGFFLEMGYRWFPANIDSRRSEIPGDERRNVFDATLVCSASPFQMDRLKIRIMTGMGPFYFNGVDINDLIKADYDEKLLNSCVASATDIEAELDAAWRHSGYDYIDIYNVGHGNADYIVGGSKRILYDIGYQYRKVPSLTKPLFPKATGSFARLKPGLVVISHWDSDHFMGCVYASDDVFDVNWIAPTLTSAADKSFSLNAFRLAAFLKAIGKLMLIDRASGCGTFYNTDIYADHVLVLKMGESSKPETRNITVRNREGLFIEIYGKEHGREYVETVLAGDVPYNSMFGSLFSSPKLRFMHVPHHCSEMILDKLKTSMWTNDFSHAIISTDKDKTGTSYNENAAHRRELGKKFGTHVHYTIGDLSRNIDEIRAVRLRKDGSVQERV